MAKSSNSRSSKKTVRTEVAAKVGHASSSPTPTSADVAARAYEIYLREGCPDGRALAHWAQAEAELGL